VLYVVKNMPKNQQLEAFLEFEQPRLTRRCVEAGRGFLQDRSLQTLVIGAIALDLCVAGQRLQAVPKVGQLVEGVLADLQRGLNHVRHG
jgi:hypothetical protein